MARIKNDNYPTDPRLARWAVDHCLIMMGKQTEDSRRNLHFLEPCCGEIAPYIRGAIDRGIQVCYGFDLLPVKDQFTDIPGVFVSIACSDILNNSSMEKFEGRFDIVATNPPYNIGEQSVKASLRMLKPFGIAAFLVRQSFLGTQKRGKFMIERPPFEVWLLTARPSYTGDGKTDMAEYCYAFWNGQGADARLRDNGSRITTLHWLENKSLCTRPIKGERVIIEK